MPRYDYGPPIGLKYNPITIAQWGLFSLQQWEKNGAPQHKSRALTCAQWLVDNARPWRHETLAWIYDYGFDLYGPYPPWISGMAQGEAVSLMLRCHQLAPNEDFARVANGAIKAFDSLFVDGGVTDRLSGGIFFQEYPTNPPVHVLNGGIFALFGVYDYARFFENEHYMNLAHQCVDTLKNHWRAWETGYWTRYDLHPTKRLASKMYQELHVREFRALAELFQVDEFYAVAERWESMLKSPLCRVRWAFGKVFEKIRLRRWS